MYRLLALASFSSLHLTNAEYPLLGRAKHIGPGNDFDYDPNFPWQFAGNKHYTLLDCQTECTKNVDCEGFFYSQGIDQYCTGLVNINQLNLDPTGSYEFYAKDVDAFLAKTGQTNCPENYHSDGTSCLPCPEGGIYDSNTDPPLYAQKDVVSTCDCAGSPCSSSGQQATCTTTVYGDLKVVDGIVKDTQNNAVTIDPPFGSPWITPVNSETMPLGQYTDDSRFIFRKPGNANDALFLQEETKFKYFSMKFNVVSDVPTVNILAFGSGPGNSDTNEYIEISSSGVKICTEKTSTNTLHQSCVEKGTLWSTNPANKEFTLTVLPDQVRLSDGTTENIVSVDWNSSKRLSFYVYFNQDYPNNGKPFWKATHGISHLQTYNFEGSDTTALTNFDFDQVDACMADLPPPQTNCVAAWSDCDKETCKETFTASTQPENGGQTCEQVYGTAENVERGCTCPTVTAAELAELTNKDDAVVERFNTLRGKAALQELDAATFAKVAEFDLRDLDAAQKKEAIKTVVTVTPQTMKLKIGDKEFEGARVRSQDKGAAQNFDDLTEEDRLTPQQPQVFVLPDNYPQFITVKRTNKVLVWKVNEAGGQPVPQPGTRRLLAATQGDCDASITATNDDGVIYVSENVTPGCYYDAATDEVLVCPVGHFCDGVNKTPCAEGTYASSIGEPSCHNAAPGYAVGTGNTDKGDCATRTIDLQNCGCCTACSACPGIGEGLTSAEVMSAVETQCGGTC